MPKRTRDLMESISDEYLCPITHELPFDPVTAMDGRVYEREAIEKWLHVKKMSPVTTEPMKGNLVPAFQARNAIEKMVMSGEVSVDKADAWKRKRKDETNFQLYEKMARDGEVDAMNITASFYRDGKGVKTDLSKAFHWMKIASSKNDARATTGLAIAYLDGQGVKRNVPRGLILLGRASELGSEHACYVLGWSYMNGYHNLGEDKTEARVWFQKMQTCGLYDSSDKCRTEAKEYVDSA